MYFIKRTLTCGSQIQSSSQRLFVLLNWRTQNSNERHCEFRQVTHREWLFTNKSSWWGVVRGRACSCSVITTIITTECKRGVRIIILLNYIWWCRRGRGRGRGRTCTTIKRKTRVRITTIFWRRDRCRVRCRVRCRFGFSYWRSSIVFFMIFI